MQTLHVCMHIAPAGAARLAHWSNSHQIHKTPRNRAPAPYRGPQDLEWSIQPPRAFRKLIEMCTATERTMRPTAAELRTRALELRDGVLSDMNKEEGMGDVVSKTGWLL